MKKSAIQTKPCHAKPNRKVKNIPEYFNGCSIYFELNMSRVREVISSKTFSVNSVGVLMLLLLVLLLLLLLFAIASCCQWICVCVCIFWVTCLFHGAWLETFCLQIDTETYCLLTRFCALETYLTVWILCKKFGGACANTKEPSPCEWVKLHSSGLSSSIFIIVQDWKKNR